MLRLSKQILGFCFLLCVGGSVEELVARRRVPAPHLDQDYNLDLSAANTAIHKKPDLTPDLNNANADADVIRQRSEGLQLTTFVAEKSEKPEPVPPAQPPPRQTRVFHYQEQEQEQRGHRNRIQIRAGSPSVTVTMGVVHGLVGSNNVTLECFTDSFPKATNFWMNEEGERLKSSPKYNITEVPISHYEFRDRLRLQILNLDYSDFTFFRCVSSNDYGAESGVIRVTAPEHIQTLPFPKKGTVAVERGSDTQLACLVDAYPIAVTYWFRVRSGDADQIVNSDKYRITEEWLSPTKYYSRLRIRDFGTTDYASAYRCVSKNKHGERLHTFYLSSDNSSKGKLQASSTKENNGNTLNTWTNYYYFHRILIFCLLQLTLAAFVH